MQNIVGLEIHEHEKSKRIINISLDDEIIKIKKIEAEKIVKYK